MLILTDQFFISAVLLSFGLWRIIVVSKTSNEAVPSFGTLLKSLKFPFLILIIIAIIILVIFIRRAFLFTPYGYEGSAILFLRANIIFSMSSYLLALLLLIFQLKSYKEKINDNHILVTLILGSILNIFLVGSLILNMNFSKLAFGTYMNWNEPVQLTTIGFFYISALLLLLVILNSKLQRWSFFKQIVILLIIIGILIKILGMVSYKLNDDHLWPDLLFWM